MSDIDVSEHIELIRSLCKPGGPLSIDAPTATINNKDWFIDGRLTLARLQLHRRLLNTVPGTADAIQDDRKAIVLAGPPGAGKSTVVSQLPDDQRAGFLNIDADVFKVALLQQALVDGSYEDFIKPESIKQYENVGYLFHPLELSALVHIESSRLAQEQRKRALDGGSNVIIDTILSNETIARHLISELTESGYSIHLIDVETTYEISHARVTKRWMESYRSATKSFDTLGGRWVPSEYIRGVFDPNTGKALSEKVALDIADEYRSVKRFQVFRVTDIDSGAELEVDRER